MTTPAHNPSHESKNQIDFIKKFEGSQPEVPAAEQLAAAQTFKEAFEGNLVAYADHTEGRLFTYLQMRAEFEDQSSLCFVLTTSSMMKAAMSSKIRVLEYDADGLPRETHDYELSSDETVVRRIDVGDSTENTATKKPPILRFIDTGHNPLAKELLGSSDAAQNFELEEQMGLNNQPVGLVEIQQLTELLSYATPVLPS